MTQRFENSRPVDALRLDGEQRKLRQSEDDFDLAHIRLLDEAASHSNRIDLKHQAADAWALIVENEPGFAYALDRLHALRMDLGQSVETRVVAELMIALGTTGEEERAQLLRETTSALGQASSAGGTDAIEFPIHPDEASRLARFFERMGYALVTACQSVLPEPRPKRRDRVEAADLGNHLGGPLMDVGSMFGAELPKIYVNETATSSILPSFFDGKPALIVGPAAAEKESELVVKFRAGWALSLLRPRALALAILPLPTIREAFEGLVRELMPEEDLITDAKPSRKRAKALEKALPDPLPPTALERLVEFFSEPGGGAFLPEREAVMRSAERAGLIACGSLLVAKGALAEDGPAYRSWWVPLIEYSASRAFMQTVSRAG
jgi:hypothetical protein